MWKPGEMGALTRPNPYSSSTIDMCGKRGFGILFSDFLRFFRNFLIAQGVPVHIVRPESQRKSICSHSEMASKGLQMPNAMELVGNRERKRNVRIREQRMGCSGNGGGSGAWYPFAPGRREKRRAAGQVRLSLARRYNTLDLAGKVSVPRGCGPFGNPREGGDGGLDDGTVWFPFGAATGAIQAVAACRGIMFSGG